MNRRLCHQSIRSRALALAAAAAVGGRSANALTMQDLLTQQGYTAIPLQRDKENHLFVEGKVHGRKAAMVIDTGAPGLGLDTSKAGGLDRLQKLPEKLQGLFGTFKSPDVAVSIDKIEIGGLSYESEPAALLRLHGKQVTHTGSHIPTSDRIKDYDLLLGWEFLSRHYAIIDNRGPTLFLRESPPSADLANSFGQSLLASGFVLVPLTARNLKIELAAAINGHPVLLLLDTGSLVTTLDGMKTSAFGADVRERVLNLADIGGNRRELFTPGSKRCASAILA